MWKTFGRPEVKNTNNIFNNIWHTHAPIGNLSFYILFEKTNLSSQLKSKRPHHYEYSWLHKGVFSLHTGHRYIFALCSYKCLQIRLLVTGRIWAMTNYKYKQSFWIVHSNNHTVVHAIHRRSINVVYFHKLDALGCRRNSHRTGCETFCVCVLWDRINVQSSA